MSASFYKPSETLEPRRFMSAIHLPKLINAYDVVGDLTSQGNGSVSNYIGNTDLPADADASGSVFHNTKIPTSRFSTGFVLSSPTMIADQQFLDFVIQRGPDTALGDGGAAGGYVGGTMPIHSAAIVIDLLGDGTTASVGFAGNGVMPTHFIPMTGVHLENNGGLYAIDANYHAGRLNFTISGGSDGPFSASEAIDLPTVVGGQNAFVGFAGSAGTPDPNGFESTLIRQWTYSAVEAPTFTTAATATLRGAGRSAALTASAEVSDHSKITYQWTDLSKPSGAATPTFSTPTLVGTMVNFNKCGTYHLRITATDAHDQSTVSDVSVRVEPVATKISISSRNPQIRFGKTSNFSAVELDQFSRPISSQPSFIYSISQGTGEIDALTGLYTASGKTGYLKIAATANDLTGFAAETVIA